MPSQTFTSSGTFTVPAGITALRIVCRARGGAGSAGDGFFGGVGGGGGAYSETLAATVTPGDACAVVIDGNRSLVQNSNESTLCEAMAGAAGANPGGFGAGGSAASGTGDIKYSGGAGGASDGGQEGGSGGGGAGSTQNGDAASPVVYYDYGVGGVVGGGDGATGPVNGLPGETGGTYGGGGSGGGATGSQAGGAGGPGVVIISWTNGGIGSANFNRFLCPGAR